MLNYYNLNVNGVEIWSALWQQTTALRPQVTVKFLTCQRESKNSTFMCSICGDTPGMTSRVLALK